MSKLTNFFLDPYQIHTYTRAHAPTHAHTHHGYNRKKMRLCFLYIIYMLPNFCVRFGFAEQCALLVSSTAVICVAYAQRLSLDMPSFFGSQTPVSGYKHLLTNGEGG